MKTKIRNIALAFSVMIAVLPAFTAQADEDLQNQARQAMSAFQQKDPSLKSFINNSAGYAIFPNVGKGGFIVGGAHGKGLVYEKGQIVGEARLTQASIGAQAGGQSFSELIVFETSDSLNDFKSSDFEMTAGVSAVAVAEGASQSAKYQQGVAVFTLPQKGLMLEAAIGGQKFKFEPLRSK